MHLLRSTFEEPSATYSSMISSDGITSVSMGIKRGRTSVEECVTSKDNLFRPILHEPTDTILRMARCIKSLY